jgi:hypothetical protein
MISVHLENGRQRATAVRPSPVSKSEEERGEATDHSRDALGRDLRSTRSRFSFASCLIYGGSIDERGQPAGSNRGLRSPDFDRRLGQACIERWASQFARRGSHFN